MMTVTAVRHVHWGWKRGLSALAQLSALALLSVLLGGCGAADESAVADEERDLAVGKARRATEKLIGSLMGEVQKSIQERGLAGTVTHCANRAQELGTLIGAEEGVVIRRVTEKTRNPVDAPDVYERQVLSRFAMMAQRGEIDASTAHVEVVYEADKRMLRFLKPITVKKPCLGCHGPANAITDDVREAIRTHYPSDMATGYNEGDLRGAVSVLVPLGEQ